MILIIFYVFVALGGLYILGLILEGFGLGIAMAFIFIPLFTWRLFQSFWKQKIWALPVWVLVGSPIWIVLYSDHSGWMWGIAGIWTLIIAMISMGISYRDGRTLGEAP